MEPEKIVAFAGKRVTAQLRAWGAPSPGHIDYEADEFKQQASMDLWIALRRRPALASGAMTSVVRRSMTDLLRKRLGRNGCKTMIRMDTESLDRFPARENSLGPDPFILYDTFDYISERLGLETGLILECFKRGATVTDIIDALQMSVSVFYSRLERIREALEN